MTAPAALAILLAGVALATHPQLVSASGPQDQPPGAGQPPAGALSLAAAIQEAMAANPALAAARLNLPVAQANVDVARERPNPELLLEKQRETPHEALTLSLPVETAGKRAHRTAAAQAAEASAEAELRRTIAETRNQVRRAYFTLTLAQVRLTQEEEAQRLAQRARDAARERFEAGAAPRLEQLQAELAVAQATNDAENARGQLAAAQAGLNSLLGRPQASPLVLSDDPLAGSVPPADEAERLALSGSTELNLLDRQVEAQRARVTLARAQRHPDPVVQGAVSHGAQPEFDWGWRAALSVTLPIFTHHQAAVLVEEATLAQLRGQRDAAAARIRGEVAGAVVQAASQRRQLDRYRDEILPRASQVEAMAEDSYRSGETGLVALLQALQSIREIRLKAVQSGLDFQVALADLEHAIGAPLP